MKVDLIIVGAGMVGSLLAAALKPYALNIALIDQSPPLEPVHDAPYEPRVSALTLASQRILMHVGAWPIVASHRIAPFTTMYVREQEGRAELHFAAKDLGQTHLGHLIENPLLQWSLTTVAQQQSALHYFAPDSVVEFIPLAQGWRLILASGEVLDAPLVVGADGAFSSVRQAANIGVATWDYHQQALVCTVQTEKPHEACARQIFLPTGPLAFLPLSAPDYCSIVWSATNEEAKQLLSLSDDEFKQQLARAFAYQLGDVLSVDRRHAFPLVARHAERYYGQGVVLIGDAAHTIHPLAGQGVNLGFLDAAVLAEEIGRALARGLPLAHPQVLSRYSRRRRGHNAMMMHSMTGLERLYAAKLPALIMARNEGVSFVNQQQWLKQLFEQHAMGLSGDLPALAI
ncbi:UbiH/UbiF/VisC/COQ6 family ubiquinone biosynthesis hydroxylase [Agitococcus lubricus]|uniref:2-octaprenyl-6-methoxyphenol hydroxylase /2-octaprenyl-3-methyl-6-methoxy-1,4-benzoquinol hydroxylase n=1 Tax=Agitococcus lubricus TaxID=1077255 RepID=A0A2T5IVE8_9GAMM|nr:UbiH/UbiF/VisC/COQ6 family ubiquinone biosynthesis hydroxylase [Agitococcus lubricus]PTQ87858.1 2-octaprenyl-6-methoxyphenol hydroxylase /2-octaprenyl-3-methyl-6-methoxy-1,4-benzoquinol hydroxylase [Agitococcus lubricus]